MFKAGDWNGLAYTFTTSDWNMPRVEHKRHVVLELRFYKCDPPTVSSACGVAFDHDYGGGIELGIPDCKACLESLDKLTWPRRDR